MQTKSITVLNQCLPCYNRCKYCLLSYVGKQLGVDYKRGFEYSKKFMDYLRSTHPEIHFSHYLGSAMESDNLIQIIDDMKKLNSPMSKFLQYDGTKFKEDNDLIRILTKIKESGVELIDLTFYGTRDYHDSFAGRKGDFDYMMKIVDIAKSINLDVEIGIPAFKDNLNQLEELINLFEDKNIDNIFVFTPHVGGRGLVLTDKKIDLNDYDEMSDHIKKYFNRRANKTPIEWRIADLQEVDSRTLHLSLLPSNIERLENQSFEETIQELEKMDNDFYSMIPSFKEMLEMYPTAEDNHLYTQKDLYAQYRRRYIKENNLNIKDIDERYNYSLRYYSEN